MTLTEEILWKVLRNRRCHGLKFRRQVNIGTYIVDFLCKEHRLVVEVDGGIHEHHDRKEYDRERSLFLQECGFRILCVKNDDVLNALPCTLDLIAKTAYKTEKHTVPLSCAQERGEG